MEIRHFKAEANCFIVAMKPFVVVRTRIEWGNEERGYFTKAFKDSIKSAVVEGLLSEQKVWQIAQEISEFQFVL